MTSLAKLLACSVKYLAGRFDVFVCSIVFVVRISLKLSLIEAVLLALQVFVSSNNCRHRFQSIYLCHVSAGQNTHLQDSCEVNECRERYSL